MTCSGAEAQLVPESVRPAPQAVRQCTVELVRRFGPSFSSQVARARPGAESQLSRKDVSSRVPARVTHCARGPCVVGPRVVERDLAATIRSLESRVEAARALGHRDRSSRRQRVSLL